MLRIAKKQKKKGSVITLAHGKWQKRGRCEWSPAASIPPFPHSSFMNIEIFLPGIERDKPERGRKGGGVDKVSEWGGWKESSRLRRGGGGGMMGCRLPWQCAGSVRRPRLLLLTDQGMSACASASLHWTTVAWSRETEQPLWELLSLCVRDGEMNVWTTVHHAGDLLILVRFWPAQTRRGFLQSPACYKTTRALTAGKYSLLFSPVPIVFPPSPSLRNM